MFAAVHTDSVPVSERHLSSIEEIIDEARNGRMFILVDDEDRENEGDLVMPAQMATPDAINFMAQHGRGLICLALSPDRIAQLGLPPMTQRNGTRHETAFTVSIEARDGVTTGISAADRARTIAVAVDATRGREHLVTPGHVFPLAARPGGVLVRAGHTEAAVDVSRLAGLNPSGVICEIMNDDGTMARMDDLLAFAQRHGLKMGTIRDLIAYRRRCDHIVERHQHSRFTSEWGGDWDAILFRNTVSGAEHLALVKGDIDPTRPVIVRMHAASVFGDMLGGKGNRSGVVRRAMEIIGDEGVGVVVIINRDGPGALFRETPDQMRPGGSLEGDELRDYGVGAQILTALGVEDMILLSDSQTTPVALAGYGLNIVEQRSVRAGRPSLAAVCPALPAACSRKAP